jgi:ribosomal protein L11 methyltransferase
MKSKKNSKSYHLLRTEISPSNLDLALGLLYQAGLPTVEEKRIRAHIELRAELKDLKSAKNILSFIKNWEDPISEEKIFQRSRILQLKPDRWAKKFQKYLKPFLLIEDKKQPLWIDPRGKIPKKLTPNTLYISASLAFGTGTHPTTQLAAKLLRKSIKENPIASLLDLGCGTGILAMVAQRQGVQEIWAVDIDPQALKMASTNLKNNRVRGVIVKNSLERVRKKFDLIVANIELIPLQKLYPTITTHLKKGGELIGSGLLYRDCKDFLKTYRTMKIKERKNLKGWSALRLQK